MKYVVGGFLRRWNLLAVSALLALILSSPAQAIETDLSWPNIPGGSPAGGAIVETVGFVQGYSHLFTWDGSEETPCSGPDDNQCKKMPDSSWGMVRLLPQCTQTTATDDCISDLRVTHGGITKSAQFLRLVDEPSWLGNPKTGLISASSQELWSDPFDTTDGHGLVVKVKANYVNISKSMAKQNWRMSNFTATISSYSTIAGDFSTVKALKKSLVSPNQISNDFKGDWVWLMPDSKCIWVEDGHCGIRQSFASSDRIELGLHLTNTQAGWLAGRLVKPSIEISKINSKVNKVVVSAEPAEVAYVQAFADRTNESLANFSKNHEGSSFSSWAFNDASALLTSAKTFLGDKATKVFKTWSVTTGYGASNAGCLQSKSKLVGLVTTNATAYQAGAPTYANGFLNYKIASLHYKPDGEANLGSYDLILDGKAARCLYGFSSAPVSASVTVTNANGENQIATSSLTEKGGWIRLSVSGFGFSAPTIKVKLIQAKAKK